MQPCQYRLLLVNPFNFRKVCLGDYLNIPYHWGWLELIILPINYIHQRTQQIHFHTIQTLWYCSRFCFSIIVSDVVDRYYIYTTMYIHYKYIVRSFPFACPVKLCSPSYTSTYYNIMRTKAYWTCGALQNIIIRTRFYVYFILVCMYVTDTGYITINFYPSYSGDNKILKQQVVRTPL